MIVCWDKAKRTHVEIIATPANLAAMKLARDALGADGTTAELTATWAYLKLPPTMKRTWKSTSDQYMDDVVKFSGTQWTARDVPYMASACYQETCEVKVLVPVAPYFGDREQQEARGSSFLEVLRGVLKEHRSRGSRLQVWMPDPSSIRQPTPHSRQAR